MAGPDPAEPRRPRRPDRAPAPGRARPTRAGWSWPVRSPARWPGGQPRRPRDAGVPAPIDPVVRAAPRRPGPADPRLHARPADLAAGLGHRRPRARRVRPVGRDRRSRGRPARPPAVLRARRADGPAGPRDGWWSGPTPPPGPPRCGCSPPTVVRRLNEELGDGTVTRDRRARDRPAQLEEGPSLGPRRPRSARHLRLSGPGATGAVRRRSASGAVSSPEAGMGTHEPPCWRSAEALRGRESRVFSGHRRPDSSTPPLRFRASGG